MAKGGNRKAAGRKPGSLTKLNREIATRAAQEGITPLEVMITAMRERAEKKDWDKAVGYAEKAAPYMHPRLATVAHTGANGGPISVVDLTKLTDEQLAALEPVLTAIAARGDASEKGSG